MEKVRTYLKRGETAKMNAQEAVGGILSMLRFDPAVFGLFEMWDREMKSLVRGCEAVGLQGTRLYVRVPSAAHKQELLYCKDRLIARVNQALGKNAVTDVQFEYAPSSMPAHREERGGEIREPRKSQFRFERS